MAKEAARGMNKTEFAERYSLVRPLGSGAYGKVFLARQHSLNRLVAIKFFAPHSTRWLEENAERFLREARLLAKLSHPNIVSIFDANLLGRSRFLVTEFLDGGDLASRLESEAPLPADEGLRVCLAVAAALEYLHAGGLVHRDLKPENILLGLDGEVKVTDFGLARPIESEQVITAPGAMMGTPAYLAPETIATGKAVAASDLHAFGILLYRCFDGRYPYDLTRGLTGLLVQKVEEKAPPPGGHVPGALASLMTACLVRDPVARPSAARARALLASLDPETGQPLPKPETAEPAAAGSATARLDELVGPGSSPGLAARPKLPPPRGLPWRALAAGGGFLAIALVVAVVFLGQPPPGGSTAPDRSAVEPSSTGSRPTQADDSAVAPGGPGTAPAGQAESGTGGLGGRQEAGRKNKRAGPLRVDFAVLRNLHNRLRPYQLEFKARSGFYGPGALRKSLEQSGCATDLRTLLTAGDEFPPGLYPEPVLGKYIVSLQALRLAAAKLRACGQELPSQFEALADAAGPHLRHLPPGTSRVLEVGRNLPVPVPLELDFLLGGGKGWTLTLSADLRDSWKRRGPHRSWWVLRVRGLSLRAVLHLHLNTVHGQRRFPFVASEKPVTDPAAKYSGVLAVGFDSNVLDRLTGPIELSYCILHGEFDAPPVLEQFELWE